VKRTEREQKQSGDVMVPSQYKKTIDDEILRHREAFIAEGFNQKRAELGYKKFEKQKETLRKEFEQTWNTMQEAKAKIRELEDCMNRKIIKWTPLEKVYRIFFEAKGEPKTVIERTLISRRRSFERAQRIVQQRLRPRVDPDQDFRQRILNPETRREAIKKYLCDHVNKAHFQAEAFNLLFEELEKRKVK